MKNPAPALVISDGQRDALGVLSRSQTAAPDRRIRVGSLGSKVTMLARSRLTSREEPEASEALAIVFADGGIRVIGGATVSALFLYDVSELSCCAS